MLNFSLRTCTIPEGPELRLSAELIKPLVINKVIVSAFQSDTGRYAHSAIDGHDKLIAYIKRGDCKVVDVNVKGKFMYWSFTDHLYMFSTYGMTGQWSPKAGKHPCFGFYFEDQSEIHFNDPRHFGSIKFTNNQVDIDNKLQTLGWDPFTGFSDDNFKFVKKYISNSKPLAQLLMDQSIFAGVGNYIKSEALYLSKLSPHRAGNSLSDTEIYELCQSIINVMESSYQHQGATISTFKTPYGNEGKYSTLFKVYGCKVDPLGNKVIKETLADKRTTHWVPQVQR